MTNRYRKMLKLIKRLCGTTLYLQDISEFTAIDKEDDKPDVPTEETFKIAKDILSLCGIRKDIVEIEEIPLCWDNQVSIRFCFPELKDLIWRNENNKEYRPTFDLSAGISCRNPDEFFIALYVESMCTDNYEMKLFSDTASISG